MIILEGLNGERVFFFDLDVLITGNLDELFSYPKDDGFSSLMIGTQREIMWVKRPVTHLL